MKCGNAFNEEEHIGLYINKLSKNIRYAANMEISQGNETVTGEQCRLMGYISRRLNMGEDVYQRDIEHEFGVKRSSVASILSNLEKGGYILRQGEESDKRIKKIILTEKGVALSEKMKNNIQRLENVISSGMSKEEKETLLRLVKKAINNVESSEFSQSNKIQSSKYKE